MNHRKSGRKLSRNTHERQALFRSLARSLFTHGSINTTEAKAKATVRLVEKLANWIITKDQLTAQRELHRYFQNRNFVKNVYQTFKSIFGNQTSNFTKISKIKFRQGDDALIVNFAFVKPYTLKIDKVENTDKKVSTDKKNISAVKKPKKSTLSKEK